MWTTAFVLGFAGSIHCLGMCSPLAMTVTSMSSGAFLNRLIYNAGRILTYASAGAVVSAVGLVVPLYNFQNILSLALGAVLLIVGLRGVKNIRIPGATSIMQKLATALKSRFAHLLKEKRLSAMFVLGLLNGLLPCGLSVLALGWCVTLRGPLDGFNFMLLFGAGTLPVMLGVTSLLPAIIKRYTFNLKNVNTAMLLLSGCLLIGRVFLQHAHHNHTSDLVEIMFCR